MHRATRRFWKCFHDLTEDIQKLARENFDLLRRDPRHPSLRFKKVGEFWSARVGLAHRALAVADDAGFTWVWIGTHDEYERIISP
ncbi:MAG: hypothetical protein K8T91_20500 [Planctomycetes bacterium]|nr:hypothetical protein [Planctomycetota bacterium]